MPLLDARMAAQDSSVPIPSGVSNPTPVTTTRRDKTHLPRSDLRLFLGRLAFNIFNRVFNRGDLLGIFVRDLKLKGFLKSHYELDDIKRIGAEVVHEGRVAVHLALIDAQLLDNNLLHLLLNCHGSSWDFVNALILATFAMFPQVARLCQTPILPYPCESCRREFGGHSNRPGKLRAADGVLPRGNSRVFHLVPSACAAQAQRNATSSSVLHPSSDLSGCSGGVLAGGLRRMPVRIPAWQAKRPLYTALDKARH